MQNIQNQLKIEFNKQQSWSMVWVRFSQMRSGARQIDIIYWNDVANWSDYDTDERVGCVVMVTPFNIHATKFNLSALACSHQFNQPNWFECSIAAIHPQRQRGTCITLIHLLSCSLRFLHQGSPHHIGTHCIGLCCPFMQMCWRVRKRSAVSLIYTIVSTWSRHCVRESFDIITPKRQTDVLFRFVCFFLRFLATDVAVGGAPSHSRHSYVVNSSYSYLWTATTTTTLGDRLCDCIVVTANVTALHSAHRTAKYPRR